jgi:hypothetical protein
MHQLSARSCGMLMPAFFLVLLADGAFACPPCPSQPPGKPQLVCVEGCGPSHCERIKPETIIPAANCAQMKLTIGRKQVSIEALPDLVSAPK